MVGTRSKDNTLNRIIVCYSIFQSLENNSPYGIGSAVSIRAIVKSVAVPGPREKVPFVKAREIIRVSHNVSTISKGRVAVTSLKSVAGSMNRC